MRQSLLLITAALVWISVATPAPAQDDVPAPIVLPAPTETGGGGDSGSITLSLVSSKPNEIVDEDRWWERNGLEKPEVYVRFPALTRGKVPEVAPANYRGLPLMAVWNSSGRRFFVYGEEIYKARYLLATSPEGGRIEFAFDAAAYGNAAWAALVDGILYLTNNPGNLSAADGGGARLFAIDVETNRLKWASAEKTCSGQFLAIAGSIVCAYGFTGEPDFIFVLDRFTGEVTQKLKLKTAANWLIPKDGRLHVRCYNTDDVYRIDIRD